MTTRVAINTDPGSVIAACGQLQSLSTDQLGTVEPDALAMTERMITELGCFGVDDKYATQIKKNLQPEVLIESMKKTKTGYCEHLHEVSTRARGAVTETSLLDIEHGKQVREYAEGTP